jgi:hypothetical protein
MSPTGGFDERVCFDLAVRRPTTHHPMLIHHPKLATPNFDDFFTLQSIRYGYFYFRFMSSYAMNITSTLVGEVVVTMFLLSVSWRFSSSNAMSIFLMLSGEGLFTTFLLPVSRWFSSSNAMNIFSMLSGEGARDMFFIPVSPLSLELCVDNAASNVGRELAKQFFEIAEISIE